MDPVWIAGQLGLEVREAVLPPNVSGALIKDRDQDPLIVLSQSDSKSRKRFTCAHELGHYADRLGKDIEQYEYIDLRGDQSSTGTNPDEVFANQFAAALLMPEEEVRRLAKAKLPAFLMAQHFGVSDDAIRYRLRNLRLKVD
ncbi:MAG TPA: ImmA/IrrE family metallo-endopeptidase [Paucimonas sp.]|nr:ImmA/IrrE family metallo-endopeptidase [Paucimonas sp.]